MGMRKLEKNHENTCYGVQISHLFIFFTTANLVNMREA